MRILALVTARGGSKGLPGKNLAPIAGRPLVAWSHRALSGLRRELAGSGTELLLRLSTDDPAIAGAWPEADRPVPDRGDLRPAHLATDEATSLDVVGYELARAARAGTPCDAVLLVQPTSPLLTTDDLHKMIDAFTAGNPSVAMITELDHPLRWSMTMDAQGRLAPAINEDNGLAGAQRQQHPPAYRPVGCYLCSAEFISDYKAFSAPRLTMGVEIPRERAIDIDDANDLATARALHADTGATRTITLAGRTIGDGHPCFVIAEAGVNHNGDPDLARALIDAAAESGADAVKFQTFRASELVTDHAEMAAYQRTNLGVTDHSQASQAKMLHRLELAESSLVSLKAHAEDRGLVFLSSPFDIESARLLAGLGVCALKLGSGELTNHRFLKEIARLGLPVLLSTGMATLDESEDASRVLREHGDPPALWFHCVSAYPAPAPSSNLRAMDSLRSALCAPVGMSDHSMGDEVTIAAVARGAVAIEKHITLSRDMEGPDHAASLEPDEFRAMVARIRDVESALGDGIKKPAACELDTITAARRSLVAAKDLPAGHVLCPDDLVAKRPGTGVCPSKADAFVGRTLLSPLVADEQISETHLAKRANTVTPDRSVA